MDGLVRLIFSAHGAYNQIYHSLLIGSHPPPAPPSIPSNRNGSCRLMIPFVQASPAPSVQFVKGPRQRDKFVKFRSVFARSSVHPFITPFRIVRLLFPKSTSTITSTTNITAPVLKYSAPFPGNNLQFIPFRIIPSNCIS